jgi:hypothetical protein
MMVPIFSGPQALSHLGSDDSKNKKKRLPHNFRPHSLRNLWHNINAAHFWSAQRSLIQYGFRKGKSTRDCLAILTTDINNSFEMKEQTVAAFLDISGAYDNVIIDILCEVMVERELLPIHIIRLLWNLLKKNKLVFYVGGIEYMSRTGYKGLPQGSDTASLGQEV